MINMLSLLYAIRNYLLCFVKAFFVKGYSFTCVTQKCFIITMCFLGNIFLPAICYSVLDTHCIQMELLKASDNTYPP